MLEATTLTLILSGGKKSEILRIKIHLLSGSHRTSVNLQDVSFSPATTIVYSTVESRFAPSSG